ncbi:hypothetical protein SOCEGT47_011580 [Sorangium cellulosum]|jgi:hypothetical protein|uniref:Uncharacterized protein n=1 Tax=Sorangium cellulosum TaxID=56 RepID=A0A4P2PV85_SORCE|nr:hypothetical protein [Sorangium cellulosum]AUX20685.1 hypothetical protein SOCEGT47_011580 [Sorangium cellulosum]
MADRRLISEVVRTRVAAEDAVLRIMDRGHPRADLCVIVSEAARRRRFAPSRVHGAAVSGHALDAILASAGAGVVVPGLRLSVAGPIAAELADASSGAASFTLTSLLVSAGVPAHRARAHEAALKEGGMFLGVHARDVADAAALGAILRDAGGGRSRSMDRGSRVFDGLGEGTAGLAERSGRVDRYAGR